MMMAQTSIISTLDADGTAGPSAVLASVNSVIRENVARLGSDHYMTMTLLRLAGPKVTAAGKHQDLLVYRAGRNQTEAIPSTGTWIGIVEDIAEYLDDFTFELGPGDVLLLFTDGITEAMNRAGEMYGQERLALSLDRYAHLPVDRILERVMEDVGEFRIEQKDDMTLVVIKRIAQ
jgi:serine phosphatase RsbU (regulator of sigma subunit)